MMLYSRARFRLEDDREDDREPKKDWVDDDNEKATITSDWRSPSRFAYMTAYPTCLNRGFVHPGSAFSSNHRVKCPQTTQTLTVLHPLV